MFPDAGWDFGLNAFECAGMVNVKNKNKQFRNEWIIVSGWTTDINTQYHAFVLENAIY